MAACHRTMRDLASQKETEPHFWLLHDVILGSGPRVSTCWTSSCAGWAAGRSGFFRHRTVVEEAQRGGKHRRKSCLGAPSTRCWFLRPFPMAVLSPSLLGPKDVFPSVFLYSQGCCFGSDASSNLALGISNIELAAEGTLEPRLLVSQF